MGGRGKPLSHVTAATNVALPMALLDRDGSLRAFSDIALPSKTVAAVHEGKATATAIFIENPEFDMKLGPDERVKATEEALEEAGIPALAESVRLGRADRKDGAVLYQLNAAASTPGYEIPWITSRLESRALGEAEI